MNKTHQEQKTCRNKRLFLEKYPDYGSVGATLKAIGVKSRKTFYNWCENDPKFKAVYETELLPNRRDTVASFVYRMATAHQNVAICPVCEGTGKYETKNCHGCHGRGWVEVHADSTQLTAAFGFLKATDHNDEPGAKDRLTFVEKNQVELTGAGGGPVRHEIIYELSDEQLAVIAAGGSAGAPKKAAIPAQSA